MSVEQVDQYLKKLNLKETPSMETKLKVAKVMEKYGDNDWWNSTDVVIRAYHQLFEGTLIINLDDIYEGLKILTGRPVFTHELVSEELRREVKERMKIYEAGGSLQTTREYQEAKTEEAIYKLHEIAEKNGSKVIELDLNENKEDSKLV